VKVLLPLSVSVKTSWPDSTTVSSIQGRATS